MDYAPIRIGRNNVFGRLSQENRTPTATAPTAAGRAHRIPERQSGIGAKGPVHHPYLADHERH